MFKICLPVSLEYRYQHNVAHPYFQLLQPLQPLQLQSAARDAEVMPKQSH